MQAGAHGTGKAFLGPAFASYITTVIASLTLGYLRLER